MRTLLAVVAVLLLAACAPPAPNKLWRDPAYAGPPLQKLFVIGLSSESLADHRGFEDMMVGTIRAAGGQAVPGYQFIPPNITPDDGVIAAAVARSGADGVLITRMSGVRSYANPLQNPYPSLDPGASPNPPYYGGQAQVATIYTTLFAANSMNQIFVYDPKTYDPADFEQQAPGYATMVVSYMQSGGVLRMQMLPR